MVESGLPVRAEELEEPSARVLVGESPALRGVRSNIMALGPSDLPVLIEGETGTGKEVVARMLHERSERPGPFVTVNCAALSDSLFESEVFGHERGAFTGADRSRAGLIEHADRGTLLLDEVGELAVSFQAKLLRAVEVGEIRRLGANAARQVNVRVLAATNRDLMAEVRDGGFRRDLYHRLAVATLRIPPLRQRLEDLAPLIRHFAGSEACTEELLEHLREHPWPGNVRELKAELEVAHVRAQKGPIRPEHVHLHCASLPPSRLGVGSGRLSTPTGQPLPLSQAVATFEREYVEYVLATVGQNKTLAAEVLRISRRTVHRKLKMGSHS